MSTDLHVQPGKPVSPQVQQAVDRLLERSDGRLRIYQDTAGRGVVIVVNDAAADMGVEIIDPPKE